MKPTHPPHKQLTAKQNNFNIIRLLAAMLVLVFHVNIFFNQTLSHGPILAQIAVSTFFMISGYLITGSFYHQKTLTRYIKARIFRIFPALLVVNFLVAFILGPILSNVSLISYYTNLSPYLYFVGTSLLFLGGHGTLIGISKSPNGSLWTLFFEFIAYIGTAILGKTRLLKTPVILCGIIFLYIISQIPFSILGNINIVTFTSLFVSYGFGTLVYLHQEKVIEFIRCSRFSLPLAVISLIISIYFTIYQERYFLYMVPFLTFIIFYLSFTDKIRFYHFGERADWSYGVYIYAWPITLALHHFMPTLNVWVANLMIIIISIFFAHLSYKLVEKPLILRAKKAK